MGEIIAGIILGPTLLGAFLPGLFHNLFLAAPQAYGAFDGIANVGIILLMFIAGFEVVLSCFYLSTGGLQEISAGNLAAQKALRPDVKAFGKRMVADHGKAQVTLMQLAKSKGYGVPSQATSPPVPNPMLTKATGKDFDSLYIHMMVPDHRQTVLLFQDYAVSGKVFFP